MVLTAMTGTQILEAIIEILVGGLTQMATGIGSGVNAFATNIFLSSDQTSLSVVAILVAVFGGIGLAVGLGRRILKWVTSFGR